ncbi:MAG: S53 family peptidase [Candidatus Korobacteraceae bacterium]|jgi:subtilase family serine protease
MTTFRKDIQIVMLTTVAVILFASAALSPASAQTRYESVYNGHRIIYPASSIPVPGRPHTNYFFVDSDQRSPQPDPSDETPGSVACVYKLVTGPSGCPIATSTTVPSGGIGAIAIVDAGYYPTAQSDLDAFDSYFGIPATTITQVWPGPIRPPSYGDWEVEEALDIEWAHAMAPQAKLFLVVSVLCSSPQCATDPTWGAVQYAGELVAQNGGGVVSMSFADAEISQETSFDQYFTTPGVVYFAASGDGGLGVSAYPAASPNVVAVGGTYFNRDGNGNFTSEQYYTGGGGGDISPYEPRPSYQNGIASIVGNFRGYPDVASDFCCTAIYLQGSWGSVGGTSWASPTFAGIVNAAGSRHQSSLAQLTTMYSELFNPIKYHADFNDITTGDSRCKVGWDLCTGIGSAHTYAGK